MKSLARLALTVVAVLLFAGCGARGVSSALPGGSSFSGAEAGATRQHEASSGPDLLYVTRGHSVRIYSYPQGKREKEIRGYYGETFEGECADSSGNVYVLDNSLVTSGNTFIYEYAHGGTTPIRTLFDHLIFDQACSVDPASGYLAVTGAEPSRFGTLVKTIGSALIYLGTSRSMPVATMNAVTCSSTEITPGTRVIFCWWSCPREATRLSA